MTLTEILNRLKAGTITVNYRSHDFGWLIETLERSIDHIHKMIEQHTKDDKDNMLPVYEKELKLNHDVGKVIFRLSLDSFDCRHCDTRLYLYLESESVLSVIDFKTYQELTKGMNWDEQSKFILTNENNKDCIAKELVNKKELVSSINVETGNLIFQNFFRTDSLYELPDEYSRPSISSLLGRNELMQYLATQNVGYGQMSNMHVEVYVNDKNEIIIGDSCDCYEDNKYYYSNHPDKIDDEWLNQCKHYESFIDLLKKGGFVNKGSICCDVWRWMCADRSVLDKHEEKPFSETEDHNYKDTIEIKVKPGIYDIHHYFDFNEGNPLYSYIKLRN